MTTLPNYIASKSTEELRYSTETGYDTEKSKVHTLQSTSNVVDQLLQYLNNELKGHREEGEKTEQVGNDVKERWHTQKAATFAQEVKEEPRSSSDFRRRHKLIIKESEAETFQTDSFYFGPPTSNVNMRDGSYTIVTVLG